MVRSDAEISPLAARRPVTSAVPRTERHRADWRKSQGVHYTPPDLAEFLAREGAAALGRAPQVILDPACGGGELLEAAWRQLPPLAQAGAKLIGFDTDTRGLDACRIRLSHAGMPEPSLYGADFIASVLTASEQGRLFGHAAQPFPLRQVDLAIANPPYVRTQTLGRDRVAAITSRYHITGRVDLYMAFAFAMADVLRTGGVLALLCSNRFLTTRAGLSLRDLLRKQFSVAAIFDFGDTRLFEAAVLPAVIIAIKSDAARPARFVSVYRDGRHEDNSLPTFSSVPRLVASGLVGHAQVEDTVLRVRRGELPAGIRPEQPWTLRDDQTTAWLDQLTKGNALTIGSLAKIHVGIKTTADSVFIRDDWASLPIDLRPEPELLHPLLTHDVAGRWYAAEPRKLVLYPHMNKNGRTVPVDLDSYPRAAAYLASHGEQLARRHYLASAGRRWYEIWVPQKADVWARPKVVFPDIAESPRFFVDTSGYVVNGDCYWAAPASLNDAFLIAAIGNSRLAETFYDAQCGNQLYAGRRRFMTQYVEQFPLPRPDSALAQQIISLARRLWSHQQDDPDGEHELEGLVCASLGVEELVR